MHKYYAVCYGHVCRWEQGETAAKAALNAFGLVDIHRMTVAQFPRNPRYMSRKKKEEFLNPLFKRHQEKTGSMIK